MIRKISLILTTIAASSILFLSCNDKKKLAEEEKEITLVMAEVNAPDSISGRMDQAFKEKVEELSKGKIKIDLQCSGVLGDNKSVREIMSKPGSSIQITRQGPIAELSSTYSLLIVPYTFKNHEHFWNFANSDTAQKLLEKPREEGKSMIGLFYGEEGFRNLFSTKKITSAKDFEGLSMRVTGEKTNQTLATSLKMNKKEIKFAKLYEALSTGEADVADQPLANYLTGHFNEVAPNVILNSHQLGIMITYITTECWDSLTPNQQKILREAGKYASEYCRKISEEGEENALKEIQSKGVTVVKVDDITPYKEGFKDYIKEATSSNPELYQEILSYAK